MDDRIAGQGVDPLGNRSHYRVSTRIPLVYESVEPSAREALADQLLSVIDPPELDLDAGLIAWLGRIERKIDLVLSTLGVENGPLLGADSEKAVLLSGSGLSFRVDHELRAGSDLLLVFELPGDRTRLIRCIGKVAHCSAETGVPGGTVGVAFDTIRPSDVDAIVQYTVSVQRQQIRAAHEKDGVEG